MTKTLYPSNTLYASNYDFQVGVDCSPMLDRALIELTKPWSTLVLDVPGYISLTKPFVQPASTMIAGVMRGSVYLLRDYTPDEPDLFHDMLPYAMCDNIIWMARERDPPLGIAVGHVARGPEDAAQRNLIKNSTVSAQGTGPHWAAGVIWNSLAGTPGYGSREIEMDNVTIARTGAYSMICAGMNAARFNGMALIDDYNTGGSLLMTGREDLTNNQNSWNGAELGDAILQCTHSSWFTTSSIGPRTFIDGTCAGNTIMSASIPAHLFQEPQGSGNVITAGKERWESAE